MMRVAEALARARVDGVDRLDAQLLLAHALGQTRTWLFAHDDAPLDAAQAQRFTAHLARRADGEPVAYLLGEKEFHGLLLQVDERVLVPRPDTEVIVDWALELLGSGALPALPRVIDLGTGSGAIALAVRQAHPAAAVTATDRSGSALAVAQDNARRLGLAVTFSQGSWWEAVPGQRFDLILANPPYIAAGDRHLPALSHEPLEALTPGGDGLDSLRAIVAGAARHAEHGAWLLLEHGHDQADAVAALLRLAALGAIDTRVDLAGQPRCTGGRF